MDKNKYNANVDITKSHLKDFEHNFDLNKYIKYPIEKEIEQEKEKEKEKEKAEQNFMFEIKIYQYSFFIFTEVENLKFFNDSSTIFTIGAGISAPLLSILIGDGLEDFTETN